MSLSITPRPNGKGLRLLLEGVVYSRDLKRGLLAIVREDGWEQPVLWDLRRVEEFAGSKGDLADTVDFAVRNMRTLPQRGRVAILVSTPAMRKLAEAYRGRWSGTTRDRIAVVETTEAADEWLDG